MRAQALSAGLTACPARLPGRLAGSGSAVWPLAAIGLLLAFQLSMVFTRAINWDEFWFYYHVADFARGNLAQPLQSLHVRLFAWLPGTPGSGVDKIVTARVVMLACETVTLAAIYALARRFVEREVALGAALLYLSAGFMLQHGFAFRTDPMAAATLMAALAILARARLTVLPLLAFAALVAVAGMITMKAVLFAPAFLGLAWLRWNEARFAPATALRLAAGGMAAVALFAALYAWHSAALTQAAGGADMAAGAGRWMFFLGLPPYWQMGVKAMTTAPVLFLLAFAAPAITWRSGLPTAEKCALTGLWLPLTLPLFYTNTAAYFYAFMLAPVAVSVVVALKAALTRYSLALVTLVLAIMATGIFAIEDRSVIERQRQVVEAADTIFPDPVAYFDFDGTVSRFTKANDFLTPWGIAQYAAGGTARYRDAMLARPVPVVLANAEVLQDLFAGRSTPFGPEDTAALRGNYLRYWGPYYVAGKRIDAAQAHLEEFLIPGTYAVAEGEVIVDGQRLQPGATVTITRGQHRVEGHGTLGWGQRLGMPAGEWDEGPLYVDF